GGEAAGSGWSWGRVEPSGTVALRLQMATEDTPGGSASQAPAARGAGPELRLLDRRAFVGFPPVELRPGIQVVDFGLQIPEVTFPFNVGAGAPRHPRRKLQFGFLQGAVRGGLIPRLVLEGGPRG